jgi:hypothetical protein
MIIGIKKITLTYFSVLHLQFLLCQLFESIYKKFEDKDLDMHYHNWIIFLGIMIADSIHILHEWSYLKAYPLWFDVVLRMKYALNFDHLFL